MQLAPLPAQRALTQATSQLQLTVQTLRLKTLLQSASSATSDSASEATNAFKAATTATDDSVSSEGKAKGLTDSDVTPGMSDADGASLVIDNSKIPAGYAADPTEGRYTFGILSLGPMNKSGLTSYNEKYNTNYYIRMSTAPNATNGVYDDTVYIQLVDANDNDKVLWEASAKPGDIDQTIMALDSTEGNPFQYSY